MVHSAADATKRVVRQKSSYAMVVAAWHTALELAREKIGWMDMSHVVSRLPMS